MTEPIPRILAIDDTPANLLTLGMALEPEFELQIATSGAMGLALAEQTPPELILLDIMMPDMDGFETCRRLKANPALRDIPVVFVSAVSEFESESKGLALGAVDYITKPINVEIARQRIRNLIEREVLRKKAVAQRNQLEKSYVEQKTMLETDLIGISKAVNRTIQWVNPAFEKMLGYGPGELIGVSTRKFYPSDKAFDDVAADTYPVIAAGGIYRGRVEQIRKNGESIWVDVNGSMLNKESGESLWVFLDVTLRKRAEDELTQQLHFGDALNAVAKAIVAGNDKNSILQATTTIVGNVLGLDRVLIYDVSFEQGLVTGLYEWLNPNHSDLHHSMGTYPLRVFKEGADELFRTQRHLISQAEDVNTHLIADGSGQLLHEQMHIRNLLWYPFDFHDQAFKALALNQVHTNRPWTQQDLNFLEAVCHQVSIALSKITMLDAQAQAREELELAASVFTHTREGIAITGPDGGILDINQAFTRITGYARDEVLGKPLSILNSGQQSQLFYDNMWRQLFAQDHWQGELWNRRKNGELYAEALTVTSVRDTSGAIEHFVALFSDVTALKEHESQLEHLAHYDALTNLPNRVLLADRLHQGMSQEMRRGKKLAVVFVDLDGFKSVNDTHGHAMGDQLLVTLALRMKQALRDGDTLARTGGDEFVAVLGDLDDINASAPMLERLLNAASQPMVIKDTSLQVSASLGVTFYPQAQDVEADQLLRQADQAMYQAKLAGKNRYSVFDAAHDSGIRSDKENIERVRLGLAQREFALYYQPKVNMRTGAVIGVEALIRWQHPDRGLLSPGQFLPAVENSQLAIALGEWVMDTALTQLESWKSLGIDMGVSVNVGARQLQQANFVERLKAMLVAHPTVEPSALEIEIVETSALEDLERVSRVIEDCRALGVMFAMDDFGTGYSSLTYLRRLQVNLLKIDQSFVRDMLDDVDDLTLLQGVIGLAKSFRRDVIAEGVETAAHGRVLLQLGCELAQGFGIARPMPADALPTWLGAWTPHAAWSNQTAIAPEDMPLLYAGVEHRNWIATMGGYLRGERPAPPPLDGHQCRFGQWFDVDCQLSYGATPIIAAIDKLHQEVHALGAELVALQKQGLNNVALNKMPALETLRDALLAQLDDLAQVKLLVR